MSEQRSASQVADSSHELRLDEAKPVNNAGHVLVLAVTLRNRIPSILMPPLQTKEGITLSFAQLDLTITMSAGRDCGLPTAV